MRIIGGRWKGRRLQMPSGRWPVRPTTDFAREALFNVLDNRFDYASSSALDLFGGTGIHCFELASRGCQDITYVDRNRKSVAYMKRMAEEMEFRLSAVSSDVLKFIKKADRQWDYIFADPPYDMEGVAELPAIVMEAGILAPDGFFVLEHAIRYSFDHLSGFFESRKYGQSVFSFFAAGS